MNNQKSQLFRNTRNNKFFLNNSIFFFDDSHEIQIKAKYSEF